MSRVPDSSFVSQLFPAFGANSSGATIWAFSIGARARVTNLNARLVKRDVRKISRLFFLRSKQHRRLPLLPLLPETRSWRSISVPARGTISRGQATYRWHSPCSEAASARAAIERTLANQQPRSWGSKSVLSGARTAGDD